MPANRHDLIVIGGGLAGGLCALAVKAARPELDLALVEPGPILGGNHLWSFFESDIEPADRWIVEPLIGHRWAGYEVRFPAYSRAFRQPYLTIESEGLDAVVRSILPDDRIIQESADEVSPTRVLLSDGRELHGSAVIDARGLAAPPPGIACGWQKFLGRLLDIPEGHGLERPIVMDATVDQVDGYRFVYCLPFSPTRLFVEDTYYSDSPDIDRAVLAGRIDGYAAARGWQVHQVLREESGSLPVVTGGDFDLFWPPQDGVARAGVRAGLFHPLTSYSLPDAVRFAAWLSRTAGLDENPGMASREFARSHWLRTSFDRLLARLLLKAADPAERYLVLQRFYRLSPSLIERFYAGRSTLTDRIRILAGKPPVRLGRAISAALGHR